MKKRLVCFGMFIVLLFSLSGCAAKDMNSKAEILIEDGAVGLDSDMEFSISDKAAGTEESTGLDSSGAPDMPESKVSESIGDLQGGSQDNIPAKPGLLTAGEWNDNHNWGFLTNLYNSQNTTYPSFGINPMKRIAVHVTDGDAPVMDARVELKDTEGNILWESISDYNGYAYVFYDVCEKEGLPAFIEAKKKEARTEQPVVPSEAVEDKQQDAVSADGQDNTAVRFPEEITLELSDTETEPALDIMFVFDTTGSMTDELVYLQEEFKDIAANVSDDKTRFSVNFYRDEGDDYVVKSNEFMDDINEVSSLLNAEAADGGGDYPEAVDQALNDGVYNHQWREGSTKLLFLILDAPPHDTAETASVLSQAVRTASAQGIRIIPIASSGIDKETEFFLRACAVLTGGTYTFLTDHSGIGGSHLEPTIGSYDVEPLNSCIIRLINQYYPSSR